MRSGWLQSSPQGLGGSWRAGGGTTSFSVSFSAPSFSSSCLFFLFMLCLLLPSFFLVYPLFSNENIASLGKNLLLKVGSFPPFSPPLPSDGTEELCLHHFSIFKPPGVGQDWKSSLSWAGVLLECTLSRDITKIVTAFPRMSKALAPRCSWR